jgi:hypothetical protein
LLIGHIGTSTLGFKNPLVQGNQEVNKNLPLFFLLLIRKMVLQKELIF